MARPGLQQSRYHYDVERLIPSAVQDVKLGGQI